MSGLTVQSQEKEAEKSVELSSHVNDDMHFFQNFGLFRKLLKNLVCRLCHSTMSLDLSSIYVCSTMLDLKCDNVDCSKNKKQIKHKTVGNDFNKGFVTALETNGITDTQISDTLGVLNFSGTNKTGKLYSTYAHGQPRRKLKKEVRRKIVEVAEANQKEELDKICKDTEVSEVVSSVDMGFPIRDFKAPGGYVSHIVKGKVVETVVVKNPPTVGEITETQVASEIYSSNKPQYFEAEGIDKMLKDGSFKQLIDHAKSIRVACDGDVKLQKMFDKFITISILFDKGEISAYADLK